MKPDLHQMLEHMSRRACSLLLNGEINVDLARGFPVDEPPGQDLVDSLAREIANMPDDLRAEFVGGKRTLAEVRLELLRRLTRRRRITPHEASCFAMYRAGISTIQAFVS